MKQKKKRLFCITDEIRSHILSVLFLLTFFLCFIFICFRLHITFSLRAFGSEESEYTIEEGEKKNNDF